MINSNKFQTTNNIQAHHKLLFKSQIIIIKDTHLQLKKQNILWSTNLQNTFNSKKPPITKMIV